MDKSEEFLPASELVSLSVELASAYVSNNSVPVGDLPKLLAELHSVLRGMNGSGAAPEPAPEEKLVPAVSIKKSVTPDFIICLEDGKSFKSLKRHLDTKYGLTPQQYRAKWNLPADYPMVAPNYAAARSAMARASGLGQQRTARPPELVTAPAPSGDAPKRRGGRPAKAANPAATDAAAPSKATAKPGRRGAGSTATGKGKRASAKAPAA